MPRLAKCGSLCKRGTVYYGIAECQPFTPYYQIRVASREDASNCRAVVQPSAMCHWAVRNPGFPSQVQSVDAACRDSNDPRFPPPFRRCRVLAVLLKHSIPIAVRYCETDAMGFLHHSNYLNYFELGRTELFRAQGGSYRRMEELEMYFVVVKFQIHYRKPARFDDQLTLTTKITRTTAARIEHGYELTRLGEILCRAESTVACLGTDGQPMRIPDNLPEITAVD
jgi:acyl-CoA thioester hydrolase